jgi:hypothetical protein
MLCGTAMTTSRRYTLFWNLQGLPPGGIAVTASIPGSWRESVDGTGAPRFALDGAPGAEPTIVAVPAPDVDTAILRAFGAATGDATREDRGGGRVWVVHRKPGGHVHARMFAPAPHGSVVMGVALLFASDAGALDEIAGVLSSIQVAT